MYVRPPNYRYTNPVRVPDNYAGNAFRHPAEPDPPPEEPESEVVEPILEPSIAASSTEEIQETSSKEDRGFRLRLGSLFGKNGSIGTEELLILALILLLADGDGDSFDDLILFLVLLFFIK